MATAWRRRCRRLPDAALVAVGGHAAGDRHRRTPARSRSRASLIRSTHRGTGRVSPGAGCAARTDRSPSHRCTSSLRCSRSTRASERAARGARRMGRGMGRRRCAARGRRRLQRARPGAAADDRCLRRITARDLAAARRRVDGTAPAARRDLRVAQPPGSGGGNRGRVAGERPPAGDRPHRGGTRADRTLGRS